MLLELVPADSATRVPIRPLPGDFTSSEGSTQDVAIDEFSIDHAGTYSLISRYSDGQTGKPVVLAIARGSTANSGRLIIAYLAGDHLCFSPVSGSEPSPSSSGFVPPGCGGVRPRRYPMPAVMASAWTQRIQSRSGVPSITSTR